jgi:hypothetical protein
MLPNTLKELRKALTRLINNNPSIVVIDNKFKINKNTVTKEAGFNRSVFRSNRLSSEVEAFLDEINKAEIIREKKKNKKQTKENVLKSKLTDNEKEIMYLRNQIIMLENKILELERAKRGKISFSILDEK